MSKIWTKEKLAVLQTYLELGLTYEEIAEKMDKSADSIDHCVRRYKLHKFKAEKVKIEVKTKDGVANTLEALNDKYFDDYKKKAKLQWNVRKSTIKNKAGKAMQSYIVIADAHVPEHNMIPIKAILYMMDDVKFDGIINLGDYMDMGCISHWNKQKKLTSEGMKLKEDYIMGNALLDEFDKRLPADCDKHFVFGNHEDWYNQFIENNPMLEGLLNPKDELHLVKRGYKVYEKINEIFQIGRLSFCHGIYCGMHYVKKHIDECKTNIMFGHLHSERERFESSPAKQLAIAGYSLGCLCDMAPEYMKNRPNKWTHGFAVVHFFEDGTFDVDLKRIVNGKFVYNSKIYDGNQ